MYVISVAKAYFFWKKVIFTTIFRNAHNVLRLKNKKIPSKKDVFPIFGRMTAMHHISVNSSINTLYADTSCA